MSHSRLQRSFSILVPAVSTLLLAVLADRLDAAEIFVRSQSSAPFDGSASHPFPTITRAIERARQLRSGRQAIKESETIIIDVGPGTYTGSYTATGERLEVLPIILNVPNLELRGKTVQTYSMDNLPKGHQALGLTTLLADGFPEPNRASMPVIILIAATTDGMVGNKVSISGFFFTVTKPVTQRCAAIWVQGVKDFRVERNEMDVPIGISSRAASGLMKSNLIEGQFVGVLAEGGNGSPPPSVWIEQNRTRRNGAHGIMVAGSPDVTLVANTGSSVLKVVPVAARQKTGLVAKVTGNDSSYNSDDGFKVWMTGLDPLQAETSIVVDVTGNTFDFNETYGIVFDTIDFRVLDRCYFDICRDVAGRITDPRAEPRRSQVIATMENNEVYGNVLATAFFGFNYFCEPRSCRLCFFEDTEYLEDSSMDITWDQADGFDYDNPASGVNRFHMITSGNEVCDEAPQGELRNSLRINGIAYTGGNMEKPDAAIGTIIGLRSNVPQKPGDCNQDGDLDVSDGVCLIGHLFLGSPVALPCGDGTPDDLSNRELLSVNGDDLLDVSDAVFILQFLFGSGPAPSLGTDCISIVGCPDNEKCR